MREIKFRAWDKTYKRMNYKVQVGNTDYADKNYTCNSIWVDYADNKSVGWMNADEKCIDLMQYTGLKDKNGKEIYELHEINNKFRVVYKFNRYILQDISNSDIFEEILQNGEYEITGEYSPLEKN